MKSFSTIKSRPLNTDIKINDENFIIDKQKCLFWSRNKVIILGDTHLGYSEQSFYLELQKLESLIHKYHPSILLILGDMFQSLRIKYWKDFIEWRNKFQDLIIYLVRGNHDTYPDKFYKEADIIQFDDSLEIESFVFSHHPIDPALYSLIGDSKYIFSAHIHPSYKIVVGENQTLKVPCFVFGKKQGIIPAFGENTGLHKIELSADDKIYAIINDKVVYV